MIDRATLVLTAALALSGCAASGPKTAPRPASITHVVLVKLADPGEVESLRADCDRLIATIPSVAAYAAGTHLETGRGVIGDYDLGLYLGFETEADYTSYVEHPQHEAIVRGWAPRLEWMRIYDFHDETH